MHNTIKYVCLAVLIAGVMLSLLGVYLCMVKAGIPYQDPTEEMALQWAAYHTAAEYNGKCGVVMILAGIVGMIGTRLWINKN